MRVVLAAVGRLKPGPERELVEDYLGRLGDFGRGIGLTLAPQVELPESRARRPDDRKREEAGALRAAIPERAFTVVLDERGRSLTSADFAALVGRKRDEGAPAFACLIGGPDGHDPALRAEAGLVLALGAMTLPHALARVVLAEQLYRAATILAGHPYHRA